MISEDIKDSLSYDFDTLTWREDKIATQLPLIIHRRTKNFSTANRRVIHNYHNNLQEQEAHSQTIYNTFVNSRSISPTSSADTVPNSPKDITLTTFIGNTKPNISFSDHGIHTLMNHHFES